MTDKKKYRALSVITENNPGVLARVSGLFARRGFNIHSLSVGITENSNISRMTIITDGDELIAEQIGKQLYKLVDVIKVMHIPAENLIERELMLVKLKCPPEKRLRYIEIARLTGAKIAVANNTTLTLEISDDKEKLNMFQSLLVPCDIIETVRTGTAALDMSLDSVGEKGN